MLTIAWCVFLLRPILDLGKRRQLDWWAVDIILLRLDCVGPPIARAQYLLFPEAAYAQNQLVGLLLLLCRGHASYIALVWRSCCGSAVTIWAYTLSVMGDGVACVLWRFSL